ncbi:calpain-13 [Petaurus breviceps papuanus]|uniref:calpain-13 n=1 Tax=Petaurus breviceps papuanus TaxID=3040969 RepID=UPI0036D9156E
MSEERRDCNSRDVEKCEINRPQQQIEDGRHEYKKEDLPYTVEYKKAIVEESHGKNLAVFCKEKLLDLRMESKLYRNNLNQQVDEGKGKKRRLQSTLTSWIVLEKFPELREKKGFLFEEAMLSNQMRPSNPNNLGSIVQFKNQDFTSLKNHCLRNGRLFEDDMFPANDSAIGQRLMNEKPILSPEWRRPKELSGMKSPHFILDGISKFDIRQGEAGDCWFLAALGSLTHKLELLAKIIPPNQSFTQGYAGIFHFQFWQCGQWVDVVVDDRLPVSSATGQYLFVYPQVGSNEFWPCLLEKAYAKLHGSYSHVHYGIMADSLVELTGWVVTKIDLQEIHPNLFKKLKVAEQSGSLITCGISDSSNNLDELGLVNNHAYTVTGSEEVILNTGREKLIRLWNPWGHREWTKRWSDKMSFQDFQQLFTSVFICHQYPMVMNDEVDDGRWSQIPYEVQTIQGNIMQDSSSDTVGNMLQYFFSVTEPMEGINAVVSINIQPTQSRKMMLLFKVYKVEHKIHDLHNPLNPMYFEFTSPIQGKNVMSKWNYTESFHLVPGTYVVVPTIDRQVKFFPRIFLKDQGANRDLQGSFKFMNFKDPDIDASQLQSLLNKELLKSNSSAPERKFALDECRSILALMDVKVNGRLDLEEFSQLWKKLVQCQDIFRKVENGSGFIMGSHLWKVIQESDTRLKGGGEGGEDRQKDRDRERQQLTYSKQDYPSQAGWLQESTALSFFIMLTSTGFQGSDVLNTQQVSHVLACFS